MGLPSYLKKQYSEYIEDEGNRCQLMFEAGENSGALWSSPKFKDAVEKGKAYMPSLMKFAYRYKKTNGRGHRAYAKGRISVMGFDKVEIDWFVGFEKKEGSIYAVDKTFMVSEWFYWKAKDINSKRRGRAIRELKLKMDIDRIRNTEQGRTFKGRLRQIIMERDGYKCVLCGKIAEDGVKLEVDHVKAWEDGGRTIYDNGRTVCSDCNKGLHWAKKFKEKLEEVQEVTA